MNFSYSGGTAQQLKWVRDAIAACSYPLSAISANVTVQWVDPLPASSDIGHAHSYMVTQDTAGVFTISIATWADNATHPENQGLPNPGQDIEGFYKESFIHELGHVTHFTLINSDDLRTKAAALFWKSEVTGGSGRRYGALTDWDVSTWVDNVKEAVADFYKAAFYTNPLIFSNRTNWNIDNGNWAALLALLAPPTPGGIHDDFSTSPDPFIAGGEGTATAGVLSVPTDGVPTSLTSYSPDQNSPTVSVSHSLKIDSLDALGSSIIILATASYPGFVPFADAILFYDPVETVTVHVPVVDSGHLGLACTVNPDGGSGVDVIDMVSGSVVNQSGSLAGANAGIIIPLPAFPFWLRLVTSPTGAVAELWATDPTLGGSPAHSVIAASPLPDTTVYPLAEMASTGGANSLFDDWRFGGPAVGTVTAPYPFEVAGNLVVGPGLRGQVAVGP